MKILVTGAAGFIGSKLMYKLAERGDDVVGIDNINDYYDVRLKFGRLAECGITAPNNDFIFGTEYKSRKFKNYRFVRMGIDDKASIDKLFEVEKFDKVVNLAAQAGVRYSITNPYAYMQSDMVGFLNIWEACHNFNVKHLIYASSSSVYGLNSKVPYNEDDKVDSPVSLYAASKKSKERQRVSQSRCSITET